MGRGLVRNRVRDQVQNQVRNQSPRDQATNSVACWCAASIGACGVDRQEDVQVGVANGNGRQLEHVVLGLLNMKGTITRQRYGECDAQLEQ
jgi:hypothetical protein